MTVLTSRNGMLEIGPGAPTVLINDAFVIEENQPDLLQGVKVGCFDQVLALADLGARLGLDMVDILVNHPALDEVQVLPALAVAIHQRIGCPVSLDSRNPAAIEAALQALHPHKALVNSVSAEPDCLEAILPLVKKYGAAVVGMPMGREPGLPKTVEGRLAAARAILAAAERHGIARDDVVMDAICLASSVEPGSMAVTLETLRAFHSELGVATILGIGNAGFGMPDTTIIDLAYLIAAVPWGLDAALVDPRTPGLVALTRAIDFLTARDEFGLRYLKHYRTQQARIKRDA